MSVLVTGGAGYIGSHTVTLLLENGYDVVIVDDFSNSNPKVLDRIRRVTGKDFLFYEVDIVDYDKLSQVFYENDIDSVIHFAGYKAVGQSVACPMEYYLNNVGGTLTLLELMRMFGVNNLVFSSSATVYGNHGASAITEKDTLCPTNPYGRTKLMIEDMLRDLCRSDPYMNVAILRYFNPVGAHPSGLLGEDPNGIPNNLMPYIAQVAVGELDVLHIYGNDYNTPDGTGVRDYIHVMDLARGHINALQQLDMNCRLVTYNLGTGVGYSVLDVVHAFREVSGQKIPYKMAPRREGDVDICYADPSKANALLHWQAKYNLQDMCRDMWRWSIINPRGYNTELG